MTFINFAKFYDNESTINKNSKNSLQPSISTIKDGNEVGMTSGPILTMAYGSGEGGLTQPEEEKISPNLTLAYGPGEAGWKEEKDIFRFADIPIKKRPKPAPTPIPKPIFNDKLPATSSQANEQEFGP